MARYRVQGPDGQIHVFEGPDGAAPADVEAFAAATFAQAGVQAEKPQPQTPAAPAASPLDTMSRTDRFLSGAGKAMTDLALGAKQRWDEAAAGLESLTPGADSINRFLGGPTAAQISQQTQQQVSEKKRLDEPLNGDGWAIGGQIAGAAAPAALLGPVGAATQGAAMGYLQPTDGGMGEVAKNSALGGVLGKVGDMAGTALTRTINPNVRPDVRLLMDEGVTPTAGQIVGGGFGRAEEKAMSLPVVGDAIAAARQRAGAQLNTAVANRALGRVGEAAPAGVTGRELVQHVRDTLGARYDALLPALTTRADQAFRQEMVGLRNMVANGAIDPRAAQMFARVLQGDMLGKFQGQGAVTGQTLKQIESDLGTRAAQFAQSTDADQRLIGDALREAQATLRRLVERTNPQHARELANINSGWADFKRLERAAAGLGAEDGVFSPAQLQNAVKALDRSKDKGAFARGQARMQDLSEAGKNVLGGKVPDSGTAGRLMGAGALGASLATPVVPLALLGGAGAYTRPAQALAARLLTQRPQGAQAVAQQLEQLSPIARALLAGTAATGAAQ